MMTMEEKCVRPADGFGFGHQRDWFNYATTPAPVYPPPFSINKMTMAMTMMTMMTKAMMMAMKMARMMIWKE